MKRKLFCYLWLLFGASVFSPVCLCQSDGPTEIEFLGDLLYFKDHRGYMSSSPWRMEDYVVNRLAKIGLPAKDVLINSLKTREGLIRHRAASAFSKMEDPKVLEVLKDYLKHSDKEIVSAVVYALELRNDSFSNRILLEQIQKGSFLASPYKPGAWEQVKDCDTIEKLVTLLESDDWEKRLYAANALVHIKEERAVDTLIEILKDDGDQELSSLKKDLQESEPEFVKLRVDMLKADIVRCHSCAALTLGHIGNDKSLNALKTLLRSREDQKRLIAAQALGVCSHPQATGLLASASKDKSIYVRYTVFELLGNQKTPESIKALKAGLKDRNPEIRAVAIKSIAKFKAPSLKDVYMDIVTNDKDSDSIPAIHALAYYKDPQVIDNLVEAAFKDDLGFVMDACMEALKLSKDPRVTRIILKHLQSKDEYTRARAARMLGKLGDPTSISTVRSYLKNDESPFVREAAAEALGNFDDKNIAEDLIEAAKNKQFWTNKGAVKSLGNFNDKEVVNLLAEIVQKDNDWDVRTIAAESLGKIQDTSSVDALIIAMKDKEEAVRKAAATSLGKINNPKSVDALIYALDTEGIIVNGREVGDGKVCDAAAEALANMQVPDLEKKLIQLFHSKNYCGRVESVRLLVRRGWIPNTLEEWIEYDIAAGLFDALPEKGSAAVEPLIAALKETNWIWVGGAAKALGKIKDERAIEPLITVLKSEGWPRQEAAKALKDFGDTRAVDPLITALQAEDWHIRAAAAEALGAFKTPKTREALKKASKDRHARVKDAALRALGN